MLAIDTNIVVRCLVDDDHTQSAQARALVSREPVFVPITVVLEANWVLISGYGYDRASVCGALRAFLGLPTVRIEDADRVAECLDLVENGLDFADALHLVRSWRCSAFVSFDRRLLKSSSDRHVPLMEP
ncbi:type II toxin-antitoxin system VapC family toxin [Salinarimonas sp.]|uniref:type II toxin-antitoxin system VapC family toxin n=1 Tax=Salinarimonas sp. TaxID=2766526 RepID=UPI0032D91F36